MDQSQNFGITVLHPKRNLEEKGLEPGDIIFEFVH